MLTVALVSEVYVDADGPARLQERLQAARNAGADVVLLPELPLNPWSPATIAVRDDDAEAPGGPREMALRTAARDASIAVVGGVIQRDARTGARYNTALLVDAGGEVVAQYRKVHLPDEPGFFETHHYQPGAEPPVVVRALGMPIGIQICSDTNRPTGTQLLASAGAEAILTPRATESGTWPRWRLVLQANALTCACYVLSVNRPAPEQAVPLGGPSLAVSPMGEVLVETTDPMALVTLDSAAVAQARRRYPGYLAWPRDVYARGWKTR